MERLAASVSHDRNISTPDTLGYDGNHSEFDPYWMLRHCNEGVVTYNGVEV
jgi:hypothetical protein